MSSLRRSTRHLIRFLEAATINSIVAESSGSSDNSNDIVSVVNSDIDVVL